MFVSGGYFSIIVFTSKKAMRENRVEKIKELIAPSLKQYIRKYEALGFPAKEAAALYYETLKTKYGVEPFILQ